MIIAISDSEMFDGVEDFESHMINLINADIDYLIIREKNLLDDQLIQLLLNIMTKSDALACQKIIVHSNAELARHLGLTQVHMPANRIGDEHLSHTEYSYSIHSIFELKLLPKDVKFALLSPVFKTTCKPSVNPVDTSTIERALAISKVPLVALGGIGAGHLSAVKEMGFSHVAMRSALMDTFNYKSLINLYKTNGF